MSVGNHCSRNPETTQSDASIQVAARHMDEAGVGCLVVVDGRERPVGIVTDRDVVIRGLAAGGAWPEIPVSSVSSRLDAKAREGTTISRALVRMGSVGIRRMPVVDSHGSLTGLFSFDDAVRCVAENLSTVADAIEAQAPERGGQAASSPEAWEAPTIRQYRTTPVSLEPGASIFDAVHLMEEHGTGSVVIVDADRKPMGILTDRDLMRRVVAVGTDPFQGSVGDVMTKDVVTAAEDASLHEVLALARSHAIRRIPLVDRGGEFVGLVSLDDVVAELSSQLAHLADALRVEMRAYHHTALERR